MSFSLITLNSVVFSFLFLSAKCVHTCELFVVCVLLAGTRLAMNTYYGLVLLKGEDTLWQDNCF